MIPWQNQDMDKAGIIVLRLHMKKQIQSNYPKSQRKWWIFTIANYQPPKKGQQQTYISNLNKLFK